MGKDAKRRKKRQANGATGSTGAAGRAKPRGATAPKRKRKAAAAAALPLPPGVPALPVPPPEGTLLAEGRHLAPYEPPPSAATAAILDSLWQTVEARRVQGDVARSHSARLIARGTAKVAQKLGEEAVECVIEATQGHREGTVMESADLLYHLVVVWVNAGIRPEEVWAELARRQGISGIAEKAARPQGILESAGTRKLP
ncbi:phosphoribosyl-ATP diphosphatase [Caldovatus aquaticus]|uniref:Phosphoribosyl-ATP pyrophosphatase n=1 Tax=Caldovatus aquaticus TaxID=2865671 RepID=A0ABS7F4T1_9PROT|nr:phosphoribosyl-ATP diphosphatase [Caldovatus aquaticus]MBW8270630.1 phosphoribosyl-ATP diphosphatase [Caldovatus aquaticus]